MTEQHTYINTYDGALLSHKYEWNFAICNNMDGPEGIILNGISQADKDKHHMISLTVGISKTKLLNKHNKTTQKINRYMEQTGSWQESGVGRMSEIGEGN